MSAEAGFAEYRKNNIRRKIITAETIKVRPLNRNVLILSATLDAKLNEYFNLDVNSTSYSVFIPLEPLA